LIFDGFELPLEFDTISLKLINTVLYYL